jgi:hypothetical protein
MMDRPDEHGAARLIDTLVADVRPVRRLWPPAARLAAWWGVGLALLGLLLVPGLRPDLALRLREPLFLVDVACIALLAGLIAHRACVAAVPGLAPSRLATTLTAGCALVLLALVFAVPIDVAMTDTARRTKGLACLVDTLVLALVPAAVLLVAIRRGAPVRPGWAGAAAGAAGWLMAYLLVRLGCGVEDGMHLGVWHLLPGLAGAALAGALAVVWIGAQR